MHFQIAQAAWHSPVYLLDHWGKPLFCLLAGPFAQWGFNGVVVFNVLVFILSMFAGQALMNHLQVNRWLQLLFPIVLLNAYDYSLTILAGLTEPLFNLGLLIVALLLIRKKWLFLAIVVSLLPFMRSEGQLPVVLIGCILVYYRQYRMLPFLLTGFVVYAIIGFFALGDFWWYFTQSPYSMGNTIYGSGDWDHYLTSYRNYLGNPGLYILMIGIPAAIVFAVQRKWEWLKPDLSFFAYGVFLGVVGLHSYFWATGQNGSMGLTRIATQGMPLFLLMHLSYIGRVRWMNTWPMKAVYAVGVIAIAWTAIQARHFPVGMGNMEKLQAEAASALKSHMPQGRKMYYYHPLFSYFSGNNPLLGTSVAKQYYGHSVEKDINTLIHPGDFIIWDSHFGPAEMALPFEKLDGIPELVLVGQFSSGSDEVRVYQLIPEEKRRVDPDGEVQKIDKVTLDITDSQEFTDVWKVLEQDTSRQHVSFMVTAPAKGFILSFESGIKDEYFMNYLNEGENGPMSFLIDPVYPFKLYIWNPDKLNGVVELSSIRISRGQLHPIMD